MPDGDQDAERELDDAADEPRVREGDRRVIAVRARRRVP